MAAADGWRGGRTRRGVGAGMTPDQPRTDPKRPGLRSAARRRFSNVVKEDISAEHRDGPHCRQDVGEPAGPTAGRFTILTVPRPTADATENPFGASYAATSRPCQSWRTRYTTPGTRTRMCLLTATGRVPRARVLGGGSGAGECVPRIQPTKKVIRRRPASAPTPGSSGASPPESTHPPSLAASRPASGPTLRPSQVLP